MKKIIVVNLLLFFSTLSYENFFNSFQTAIKAEDIKQCEIIFSKMEKPINFMKENGGPLVYSAVCANVPQIVALFLGYKAPVDYVDHQGYTPLMYAACHDYVECMRLLMAHGASVNYSNEQQGLTALHCAIDWEKIEATKLLLSFGADLFKRDNIGHTPYMIAKTSFYKQYLMPVVSYYYKRMLATNSKKIAIENENKCLKTQFVTERLKTLNYDYCRVALYYAQLNGHRINNNNALEYIKKLPPEEAQYEAVNYLYHYCFAETSETNKN